MSFCYVLLADIDSLLFPVKLVLPGDLRSWESPQTLPALFIGPFEHVERFRNLKFAVKSSQTFRVLF